MPTDTLLHEFGRVDESHLCPVCNHDSWCMVALDGLRVLCRRVESDVEWGVAGYLHEFDEPVETPEPPNKVPARTPADVTRIYNSFRHDRSKLLELADTLGVSLSAVLAVGAKWTGSRWAFPMFGDAYQMVGIRFRDAEGNKRSLAGATNGAFIMGTSRGVSGKVFGVTEGPTDLAALASMGMDGVGLPSCTPTRETYNLVARVIGDSRVVVFADDDIGGVRGAIQTKRVLSGLPRYSLQDMRDRTPVVLVARKGDLRACYNEGATWRHVVSAVRGKPNEFFRLL